MKITKVLIKNYRSIKKLEINFKNLFGLIGANSAGKSNILRAINFVLGERYPMPYSLSSKDFFNEDISNNITIEIHFDEKFASYNTECKGIIFQTTYDAGTNSFGAELKAIECSTNQSQRYRLRGDTKEQFPIVFIPATRNFEYHLQSSAEWSFLGKIIKQFNEIFPAEKISGLNSKFDEVKSQLETEKFKEFEKTFKDAFNEHVLPTQNEIDIGFKAFDPKSYYKTIEIIPKEYGDIRNIDQMGEGMKNLIFIALFRAYAKSFPKSTIFLIEEPELYLHPQGRADLFNIFKTLSEGGSQIIYSTHSQEFIDIERFSSIGLVNKIKDGDEYCTRLIQIEESAFLEKWKQQTGVVSATTESIKLFLKNVSDAETNKAFFANKIVFVEGTTEKWLLPIYALKEKVELEKNNIEILNTRGKNNIEKFYILFKELGYKIYVIFDGDKTKRQGEETNKKLTKIFTGLEESWPATKIETNYAVFEDDIESVLKKEINNFDTLKGEAKNIYGLKPNSNKEIIARYIADKTSTPNFIKQIFEKIKSI